MGSPPFKRAARASPHVEDDERIESSAVLTHPHGRELSPSARREADDNLVASDAANDRPGWDEERT